MSGIIGSDRTGDYSLQEWLPGSLGSRSDSRRALELAVGGGVSSAQRENVVAHFKKLALIPSPAASSASSELQLLLVEHSELDGPSFLPLEKGVTNNHLPVSCKVFLALEDAAGIELGHPETRIRLSGRCGDDSSFAATAFDESGSGGDARPGNDIATESENEREPAFEGDDEHMGPGIGSAAATGGDALHPAPGASSSSAALGRSTQPKASSTPKPKRRGLEQALQSTPGAPRSGLGFSLTPSALSAQSSSSSSSSSAEAVAQQQQAVEAERKRNLRELHGRLRRRGLKIIEVKRDGDCLPRSILISLGIITSDTSVS